MTFKRILALLAIFVALAWVSPTTVNAQCSGSPLILPMNQNNGQDGIMFNITALTDVTIDSVWANFDAGTIPVAEIWSCAAGIVGNQATAGAWTLAGSANSVLSAGTNNSTHIPVYINVPILSGATTGFYVTSTGTSGPIMRYTNGAGTAGNLFSGNTDITLSQGYGKDYPFGATFNPRQFNGRVFYSCCPTPNAPQGPISGDTTLCLGDTVVFSVPFDTNAVSYTWTVPAGDTIILGENDSSMTMVVGPNSSGGQICVSLTDTCTSSPDICISYTVNQPTPPPAITGVLSICQNDSAWYSVPAASGIIGYNWFLPGGATFLSTQDSNEIHVGFASVGGEICVQVIDSCAVSDTTCLNVAINPNPTLANAGPDRTVCAGNMANLAATSASNGDGVWSVVSAPGPGTFTDSTDNLSGYTSLSPGQHILRWTVNSLGCPSTSDIMTVDIIATPIADFTTANVCEGTPVGFQDLSSSNGSSITSWLWDVTGNGVDNYSNQSPTHSYNAPGIYNVRLIVSAQGCADTLYQNVAVNPTPDLDISIDNKCFQQAVEIDNNSTISLGSIDSVSWDFGDGSAVISSQGPSLNLEPTHNYIVPGQYTITHTATSAAGCFASTVNSIEVYHLPVADFSAVNACQYQSTEFEDESTVIGANIDSWAWSFGDGTDSSFLQDPTHDYDINGIVDVTLTVVSDEGCIDQHVLNLEVYPTPVNEFNYSNKVCLGDTQYLYDQSSIAYGSISQFLWLVADSFEYSGQEVWHKFDEVGLYHVTLTTVSDQGCRATIEKDIPVYEVPEARFIYNNACQDDDIAFIDSTQFSGAILSFTWNFGDETALVFEQSPIHAFDSFGIYDVTLRVESFKGCVGEVTHSVKSFERVIPNFSVLPDSGCSPLGVVFEDSSMSVTERDYTRTWYYGDGSSRFDTAEYVYINTSGRIRVYDVTLQILTDEGCLGSTTLDSSITVFPQPLALFSSDPELEVLKTTNPLVQFKNESVQANWLLWEFGDGERSREQNPAHEYKFEGEYDVMLVARNVFDCTDTLRKKAIVHHANVPFIPSAFTPNGDGMNDVFRIEGLQDVEDVSLEIFDRWGHIIMKAEGLDAQWDGTNNQSRLVQQGVYNYRLIYTDALGERFEISGNLSVLGVEK